MIGKKLGMGQIFDKEGNVVPVTLVETGPCTILEFLDQPLKVKLGYQPIKESKTSKPRLGFFKKIKVSPLKYIREFNSTDNAEYKIGQEIKADFFKPGDYVDVRGKTVGKGFQGGMKRFGWSGGPAGHGSMHHRRVGSIGACADPSRTFKGRNMPGQMGSDMTITQGLRVMDVNVENNILAIKGSIPGHKNTIILINRSIKKAWRALDEEKVVVVRKVNPMKQSKAKAGTKAKKKGK